MEKILRALVDIRDIKFRMDDDATDRLSRWVITMLHVIDNIIKEWGPCYRESGHRRIQYATSWHSAGVCSGYLCGEQLNGTMEMFLQALVDIRNFKFRRDDDATDRMCRLEFWMWYFQPIKSWENSHRHSWNIQEIVLAPLPPWKISTLNEGTHSVCQYLFRTLSGCYASPYTSGSLLSRQYTPMLLTMFAVLISARQYMGDPIHCWCPEQVRLVHSRLESSWRSLRDITWFILDLGTQYFDIHKVLHITHTTESVC